jgi:two-component system, cell cycle response regulator
MNESVLLIDIGASLPPTFDEYFRGLGFQLERVTEKSEGLAKVSTTHYLYVFYSFHSNEREATDFLQELWMRAQRPTQIFAIGPDSVPVAVCALQNGARHYWSLPLDLAELKTFFDAGFSVDLSKPGYHREGTLLQVIKEIALTMELDGLVNILIDSAMELTRADGGALFLMDEKSHLLVMKAIRGFSVKDPQTEFFGLPEEEYYSVLQKKKPLFLRPSDPPLLASNRQTVDAMILVPIWSREQPLGILVIVKFRGGERTFSNDDFQMISLLGEEISGAVYNAIIHYQTKELTIKDDLTEAYNRRYFERYLEEEFLRARRYASNLSLIFFDVDNLKDVNVKHGHLIGSKMLQEIAHRMILTVRGIDKVVRYGGDEFCVVLPETETAGAYQVADRIRNIVASRPFRINENIQVTLTGSIGIACFPIHASSKEELIRQADRAMFVIKNKTKNAIGVAETIS